MTTAFAGSEIVFVCVEPLLVPAAAAVKAGFPHDPVQTELGQVEPVTSPE